MSNLIQILIFGLLTCACASTNDEFKDATDDQNKLALLQRQIAQLTAEIYLLKEQNISLRQPENQTIDAHKSDSDDAKIAKYPTVFGPEKIFDQATQEYKRAQYDDAIVTLKRHRNFFPNATNAADVLMLLSEGYIKTAQWDLALESLRILEQDFASPNLMGQLMGKMKYLQGVALEHLGKKSQAKASYLEATASNPDSDVAKDAALALRNLRVEK